jgi:integral membrane protein
VAAVTKFQIGYLRLLGVMEGLSLLFLLCVAMPVRALTQDPSLVQQAGSFHGLLFIMYISTLADAALTASWPKRNLFIGLGMSSLPFGAFWFDRKYLKNREF